MLSHFMTSIQLIPKGASNKGEEHWMTGYRLDMSLQIETHVVFQRRSSTHLMTLLSVRLPQEKHLEIETSICKDRLAGN